MELLTNLRRAAASLFGAQLTPPATAGASDLKLARLPTSASIVETEERNVRQDAIAGVGYHIHQIEALNRESRIRSKPICTELETPVYEAAAQIVAKINKHKSIDGWWRAFAQVSMGEMIAIPGDTEKPMSRARAAFNSKRVDVVICDSDFLPVLAIEHQDWSHRRDEAKRRDEVKATALAKAGIKLVKTYPGWEQQKTYAVIRSALEACRPELKALR